MKRQLLLSLAFAIGLALPSFGQSDIRNCGMQAHMSELLQDDDYRLQHERMLRQIEGVIEAQGGTRTCANPVQVPIAVHYQRLKGKNYDESCLIALAQSQINILNEDYGGYNIDIDNWVNGASAFFPGVSNGEACIEFCLATTNHPSGYGLSDGDPAVTFNQTNGDFDANWAGYINIFVRNISYLGYSPYGGQGNGDGVVIDDNAFGSGNGCGSISPGAPYNLGRTLTHELGHYLLLDHIWGPGSSNADNCNDSDLVGDTPNQSKAYGGCPQNGIASCGSNDMHMNYMDYVYDACMYMFSAGQANRMEAYLANSLGHLITNANVVCGGGGPEPTCDDGVQNGQETGIDCGGPICDPCGTAGCDAPSGLQSNKRKGGSEITFSWQSVASALSYEFQFRESGTTNWTSYNTSNTSLTISGLNRRSQYEWRVRSICENEMSPWAMAMTRESLLREVQIYPNPVTDQVQVDIPFASITTPASIYLSDLTGRRVYSNDQVTTSVLPISVQHLTQGTYILSVQCMDIRTVQKLTVLK